MERRCGRGRPGWCYRLCRATAAASTSLGHDGAARRDLLRLPGRAAERRGIGDRWCWMRVYSSLAAPGEPSPRSTTSPSRPSTSPRPRTPRTRPPSRYSGAPAVLTADGAAAFAGLLHRGHRAGLAQLLLAGRATAAPPTPTVSGLQDGWAAPRWRDHHRLRYRLRLPNAAGDRRDPAAARRRQVRRRVRRVRQVRRHLEAQRGRASLGAQDRRASRGWSVPPTSRRSASPERSRLNADGSFSITLDRIPQPRRRSPATTASTPTAGGGAGYTPFETYTRRSRSASTPIVVGVADQRSRPQRRHGDRAGLELRSERARNQWHPPAAERQVRRLVRDLRQVRGHLEAERGRTVVRLARWATRSGWSTPADAAGLGAQAVAINADGSFSLTLDRRSEPGCVRRQLRHLHLRRAAGPTYAPVRDLHASRVHAGDPDHDRP